MIWIKKFSGLLPVMNQKLCDLYSTILLELEIVDKNDVIVVAMATLTFQYGRHFVLEKTSGKKFCKAKNFLPYRVRTGDLRNTDLVITTVLCSTN